MNDDYLEEEGIIIEGTIIRETDKAIAISLDPLEEGIWLPKSQIEYTGDVGDEVEVLLTTWLAEEKGFI